MIQVYQLPKFYLFLLESLTDFVPDSSEDIGLVDGNLTNKWYDSKRSNFSYIYIRFTYALFVNYLIKRYLRKITGYKFNNKINQLCLPVNSYFEGDSIELHRDRDMFDPKETVNQVAVITLDQKGYSRFKVYTNMICTPDGKSCSKTKETEEITVPTQTGQIIVFDNLTTAHDFKCERGHRISLTYRSNL
jgi:hypothetical protein